MSTPIDKEKELREMNESQASLVNALESIHTLLEESETKLSAARESLEGSRIDNSKHYNPSLSQNQGKQAPSISEFNAENSFEPIEEKDVEDELVVPVLDDIVIPSIQVDTLPLFTEEQTFIENAVDISDSRKQEFINKLEHIQLEMDDYLNEMLVRCMASIELELKETLSKKLEELRAIIEK